MSTIEGTRILLPSTQRHRRLSIADRRSQRLHLFPLRPFSSGSIGEDLEHQPLQAPPPTVRATSGALYRFLYYIEFGEIWTEFIHRSRGAVKHTLRRRRERRPATGECPGGPSSEATGSEGGRPLPPLIVPAFHTGSNMGRPHRTGPNMGRPDRTGPNMGRPDRTGPNMGRPKKSDPCTRGKAENDRRRYA